MPFPCALDNTLNVRMLRLPSQQTLRLLGAGDEHGRISGTARHFSNGNRMTGDMAGDVDDLADGETAAAAEVANQLLLAFQALQGEDMRGGEVVDVDVITHAGSVFRGVVATKDGDKLALAERHLQNQGNKMALAAMSFAARCGGPGGLD